MKKQINQFQQSSFKKCLLVHIHVFNMEILIMNKVFTIFLCLLIIMMGCTSIHQITYYSEIDNKNYGKSILVELNSGKTVRGDLTEIGIDSSASIESRLENGILSSSEISAIHLKDHPMGALEGFGIGFIPGAISGGVLIALVGGKDAAGDQMGYDSIVALVAIAGGLTGIIGSGIGVAIGHTDKYIIRSQFPIEYIILENSEIQNLDK
jgi:hypothetical protein